jgi:hypothetical protein
VLPGKVKLHKSRAGTKVALAAALTDLCRLMCEARSPCLWRKRTWPSEIRRPVSNRRVLEVGSRRLRCDHAQLPEHPQYTMSRWQLLSRSDDGSSEYVRGKPR